MSQNYFNTNAGSWDRMSSEQDAAKLAGLVDRLELRPGSTILDVGTGTGVLVPFLEAAVGSTGRVFALDFAVRMLSLAQNKEHSGNIAYLLADIGHVPVRSAEFEAVVCYSCFPHFMDKPRALLEIFRVLKPGGRLFICHTSGRLHINHIHRNIPSLQDHLLPEKTEMQQLLSAAGFSNVKIEDSPDSYLAVAERLDL